MSFCQNCGAKIAGTPFCGSCGAPAPAASPALGPPPPQYQQAYPPIAQQPAYPPQPGSYTGQPGYQQPGGYPPQPVYPSPQPGFPSAQPQYPQQGYGGTQSPPQGYAPPPQQQGYGQPPQPQVHVQTTTTTVQTAPKKGGGLGGFMGALAGAVGAVAGAAIGAAIEASHRMPHNSTSDVVFLHSPNNGKNVQCVDLHGRAFSTNSNKGAYEEVRIKHHNGSYFIQSVRNGNNLQCPTVYIKMPFNIGDVIYADCKVKFENKNEGAYEAWDIETHQSKWGLGFYFVSKHTGKVLQSTPVGELKCDNHNRKEYETFHILHRDGSRYHPHGGGGGGGETIIRAWYGESAFSGRGCDVTRKVRKHHAKGNLRIRADNAVFGDPAHGTLKHLWIEYRSGRGSATVQAREHEFCTLDVGGGGHGIASQMASMHVGPGAGGHHHPAGPAGHHHHPPGPGAGGRHHPAGPAGHHHPPPHHQHGAGGHHGPPGPLHVGRRYHLEGCTSGKNLAIKSDGTVHCHGGTGNHATFTVESNRGALQFKNDAGDYLACQNGNIKKGGGGKWCDFHVRQHGAHVMIRSVHGDHGVGFEGDGSVRDSNHVKEGRMAQFKVHPC